MYISSNYHLLVSRITYIRYRLWKKDIGQPLIETVLDIQTWYLLVLAPEEIQLPTSNNLHLGHIWPPSTSTYWTKHCYSIIDILKMVPVG